jgi:crotonobetainyl-CoA:carnitine CoA-transferase CaiB-like acyl-CoA transferase
MEGALSGIRILDLTAMVTGPMATQMLGDMGADIIKVEPPGIGDIIRNLGTARGGMSSWFAGVNRSKRSVVINLKEARGVELVHELAAKSDVIIQNFRPGVVERLGIEEKAIRASNKNIIYISVSAYGESGPYAGKPAFDLIIQGLTGYADIQRDPDGGDPEYVRQAIVDKITAYTVSQGILAALFARERGKGAQHVKISMIDAAISLVWAESMTNQAILEDDLVEVPNISKVFRVIKTADGFVASCAMTEPQIQGLLKAMGRDDLVGDPRFLTIKEVMDNIDEFWSELKFKENPPTSSELISRLESEDVPAGVILNRDELTSNAHIKQMGIFEEFDHPIVGRMVQARPPIQFEKTPAAIQRPAPGLGQHSVEVLQELLDISEEGIEELVSNGIVHTAS